MKLALEVNGFPGEIYNPAQNFPAQTTTIGSAATSLLDIGLYIGGTLMFFWAVWGVFDYLKAEGNKEGLAKARKKIQWAIAGFIILIFSFFISDYLVPLIARSGIETRTVTPLTQ